MLEEEALNRVPLLCRSPRKKKLEERLYKPWKFVIQDPSRSKSEMIREEAVILPSKSASLVGSDLTPTIRGSWETKTSGFSNCQGLVYIPEKGGTHIFRLGLSPKRTKAASTKRLWRRLLKIVNVAKINTDWRGRKRKIYGEWHVDFYPRGPAAPFIVDFSFPSML